MALIVSSIGCSPAKTPIHAPVVEVPFLKSEVHGTDAGRKNSEYCIVASEIHGHANNAYTEKLPVQGIFSEGDYIFNEKKQLNYNATHPLPLFFIEEKSWRITTVTEGSVEIRITESMDLDIEKVKRHLKRDITAEEELALQILRNPDDIPRGKIEFTVTLPDSGTIREGDFYLSEEDFRKFLSFQGISFLCFETISRDQARISVE